MALASARGLIRWASLRQLEETACSTAAVISRGLATSPAAAAALGANAQPASDEPATSGRSSRGVAPDVPLSEELVKVLLKKGKLGPFQRLLGPKLSVKVILAAGKLDAVDPLTLSQATTWLAAAGGSSKSDVIKQIILQHPGLLSWQQQQVQKGVTAVAKGLQLTTQQAASVAARAPSLLDKSVEELEQLFRWMQQLTGAPDAKMAAAISADPMFLVTKQEAVERHWRRIAELCALEPQHWGTQLQQLEPRSIAKCLRGIRQAKWVPLRLQYLLQKHKAGELAELPALTAVVKLNALQFELQHPGFKHQR